MQESKTITLPSGKTAVIAPFKGKHVRDAQRISDGDASKFMFAMIATSTTIDGQPFVMEDLDEMDGKDVMSLMAEFSTANF